MLQVDTDERAGVRDAVLLKVEWERDEVQSATEEGQRYELWTEVVEDGQEDFGWEVVENLDWRRRNSSILAVRGKRAVPWTTTGMVVGRGSSGHHRLHGRRTGNVS